MIESASNSFIPKRNPGTKPRQARTRNVFILSIVSYALFVSAPLASAGVFIYKLQAEKNATAAISELDAAIVTFNEDDFKRVIEYEERLKRVEFLVGSHVSISSLLQILNDATAQTVQFKDLEINRVDDTNVVVKAALRTSALDGVLFQRGQYKATPEIKTTQLSQIKFSAPQNDVGGVISSTNEVNLLAEFSFTADEIKYVPLSFQNTVAPFVPEIETDSAPTTTPPVNENSL